MPKLPAEAASPTPTAPRVRRHHLEAGVTGVTWTQELTSEPATLPSPLCDILTGDLWDMSFVASTSSNSADALSIRSLPGNDVHVPFKRPPCSP